MSQLNLSELIINAFIQGFISVWPIFKPYIYAAIGLLILYTIAKWLVYNYSILAGSSKREAKRRVKEAQNLFNLVSAAHDIESK